MQSFTVPTSGLPALESIKGDNPSPSLLDAFHNHLTEYGIQYEPYRVSLAFKSLTKNPDKLLELRRKIREDPLWDPTSFICNTLRAPRHEKSGNYIRVLAMSGKELFPFFEGMHEGEMPRNQTVTRLLELTRNHPDHTFRLLYAGESTKLVYGRLTYDVAAGQNYVLKGGNWRESSGQRKSLCLSLCAFLAQKMRTEKEKLSKEKARELLIDQWQYIPAANKIGDLWTQDIQEQILIWATNHQINLDVGGKRPFPMLPKELMKRLANTSDVREHSEHAFL